MLDPDPDSGVQITNLNLNPQKTDLLDPDPDSAVQITNLNLNPQKTDFSDPDPDSGVLYKPKFESAINRFAKAVSGFRCSN